MQQHIWTMINKWAAHCCCTFNMHRWAKSLAEDTAERITQHPQAPPALCKGLQVWARKSLISHVITLCPHMWRLLSLNVRFICWPARSRLSTVMPSEWPQAVAPMAAFPCKTFSEECGTHPHWPLHILFSDILSNCQAAACLKTALWFLQFTAE